MTFRWWRKIQNTSLVTLVTSLHQTRYGRGRLISRTNPTGLCDSVGSGSRKYDSRTLARWHRSVVEADFKYVNSSQVIIFRVMNSLGPFFSSSKTICNRAGNRVAWISSSCLSAKAVVESALRQRRTSCNRASSCSSLVSSQQGYENTDMLLTSTPPPLSYATNQQSLPCHLVE